MLSGSYLLFIYFYNNFIAFLFKRYRYTGKIQDIAIYFFNNELNISIII